MNKTHENGIHPFCEAWDIRTNTSFIGVKSLCVMCAPLDFTSKHISTDQSQSCSFAHEGGLTVGYVP
ncbi:hypothetical protein DmAi_26020 [Acetobacter persici]|uniref:Uncharacterized protein n=1 Tax=Acetobacter persici TaxID=1076596 RepID=A0A6V8IAC9_9PROT|nr:hypothetical protein HK19_13210 [Acetobacter persici]GFE94543.1 hypothetical protein DmAi_26020 [Acetobacter persici]